ncbi:uncharacterized protein LOC119674773 [Teleopsis dalmanni]|uniref:uncharacterized protein LOC119674773 n=1 Tax=Teleopsis dalmanni TaxID=139649 RepID=UPI0018CE0379|nr:uncharacterized protein LOC119674773 [Teleopsis dalmanni]
MLPIPTPMHLLEIRIILLCLPSILLATTLEPDQKSILTDSDWKKLWMRGGINADSKLDNNLDSSDSPMFEDSEMMAHNTTVQLGGTAFLVCKVSGVDRVGVNWIPQIAAFKTPNVCIAKLENRSIDDLFAYIRRTPQLLVTNGRNAAQTIDTQVQYSWMIEAANRPHF